MPRGDPGGYRPPSFDEFYQRKLDAIKVELKGVLYGDTPFVVGPEYACKKCQCRLKLHTQEGGWYCLQCAKWPSYAPRHWSKEMRAKVEAIMQGYPDLEACAKEWKPPKKEPSRVLSTETVAFGARVEEARLARGWSQEELAAKIFKKGGENISVATINMVEKGHQNCSPHVREQLLEVLGLKEGVVV
jgi:ribosome-binding protein aMBF1 (putative translation factor)